MTNGNHSDTKKAASEAILKALEAIPGDVWEKGELLHQLECDAAIHYATIKAVNMVNSTKIKEERKVQRFIASRLRYQENFGFGMGVNRKNQTKQ